MADTKKCIVWLRKDLRLADQPSFQHAIDAGFEILPLFIWNPEEHRWSDGAASRWWLHHALVDLGEQLDELGTSLTIIKATADTEQTLVKIVADLKIDAVFWGLRYEPEIIARDTRIKKKLRDTGIEVKSFNSHLLFEPHTISNRAGTHYKVFTPFWKSCLERVVPPLVTPHWESVQWMQSELASSSVSELNLLPSIGWDSEFYKHWSPTRAGAEHRLKSLLKGKAIAYGTKRDFPSEDGTSKLSPWLQWGQISPKEIYHPLERLNEGPVEQGYLRQLFWREFSHHMLYHAPHSTERPLKPEYEAFHCNQNTEFLHAWQKGMTGYPIIDAGMRQLWQTGWMHNRVRMIVSSFFVKHLQQDWRDGASWFWDTLVDADLANNTMGWQWVAGSGADASPYYRIFNPIKQGEKFDAEGEYVRKYCPELSALPNKYIHQPWSMPQRELLATGITLGIEYPEPIISHEKGRGLALDAYAQFKRSKE